MEDLAQLAQALTQVYNTLTYADFVLFLQTTLIGKILSTIFYLGLGALVLYFSEIIMDVVMNGALLIMILGVIYLLGRLLVLLGSEIVSVLIDQLKAFQS